MQFPSDDQKALFSMKLGDRSSRTFAPGSRKIEITFKISEGLAGLRDKLQVFINKTIRDLKREKKQKFEFDLFGMISKRAKPRDLGDECVAGNVSLLSHERCFTSCKG